MTSSSARRRAAFEIVFASPMFFRFNRAFAALDNFTMTSPHVFVVIIVIWKFNPTGMLHLYMGSMGAVSGST